MKIEKCDFELFDIFEYNQVKAWNAAPVNKIETQNDADGQKFCIIYKNKHKLWNLFALGCPSKLNRISDISNVWPLIGFILDLRFFPKGIQFKRYCIELQRKFEEIIFIYCELNYAKLSLLV